jgi:hypothetical protein
MPEIFLNPHGQGAKIRVLITDANDDDYFTKMNLPFDMAPVVLFLNIRI